MQLLRMAIVMVLLAGCAAQPEMQTGPDAEVTADGLVRVDNALFSQTYVRPGINLRQYRSILPELLGIDYRDVVTNPDERFPASGRNEYALTEGQKQNLEELIHEVFAEAFADSKHFTVVDQPGEGVLAVKGGFTDVVSFVPPQRPQRDQIYLSELGQGTLVLELSDSLSGESLVRAADRKRVEPSRTTLMLRETNPVINRQEVRRLLKRWATQLVAAMDDLYEQGGAAL